ncbi:MAG: HAD-IIA family hydrolase [Candidatus Kariarchaeaceae archaeon]|jgi:4-nitrophenyl phosphatase
MSIEAHEIIMQSKLIIFDSDGCLVEEGVPYPYAIQLLDLLKKLDKYIVIFTNNSTTHPEDLLSHYTSLGIEVDRVMNSGRLAANYCQKNEIKSVFIVGEKGLYDTFRDNDIRIADNDVEAVIVGMDRTLTYEKLAVATRLIRDGARFIATNPDKSFPTTRGLEPGAGSMIAAIEASTDETPEIILGKPSIWGYLEILSEFEVTVGESVMLGDRYETDILGAQKAGMRGILMHTGVMGDRIRNNLYIDIGNAVESKSMEELYNNLTAILNP